MWTWWVKWSKVEKTDGVIASPASWSQASKVTLVDLGAMVLLASTDLPAGRETLVRQVSLVSKAESLITDLLYMLSLVKQRVNIISSVCTVMAKSFIYLLIKDLLDIKGYTGQRMNMEVEEKEEGHREASWM